MKKMIHRGIPELEGESAKLFEEKADENLKNAGTVDFSKENENARKILEKSNI